jgi:hypothetical protein
MRARGLILTIVCYYPDGFSSNGWVWRAIADFIKAVAIIKISKQMTIPGTTIPLRIGHWNN